jgi:hypothetical protein
LPLREPPRLRVVAEEVCTSGLENSDPRGKSVSCRREKASLNIAEAGTVKTQIDFPRTAFSFAIGSPNPNISHQL